ncbi:TPA: dolichol monophosphate mannose synthase [Escherichia coli]|nr:dolichol monophosphate mannose synthase [Escherichia coli]HDW2612558.1 dolichol monophosphate mannose synthase [Escherichia coli]
MLFFILRVKKPCKTIEIATHFGLSVYQARHYLMCLEKDGRISRSPPRRGSITLWETTGTE